LVLHTSTVAADMSCHDARPADLALENALVFGAGPAIATILISVTAFVPSRAKPRH
jgi:hypothetical protein